MHVTVSNIRNSPWEVKTGVFQDSVLGPLVFLLYVNHLPHSILNNCKFFADDLKIYLKYLSSTSFSLALGTSSCQNNIDNICRTASSWGLDLNMSKCDVLRFQRGTIDWHHIGALSNYYLLGHTISLVDSHKRSWCPGGLRFHQHIRSVVNKASVLSANFSDVLSVDLRISCCHFTKHI